VCRDASGIYEVEKRLKKAWGDRLGIIALERGENQYTLRRTASLASIDLEEAYGKLNLLDPRVDPVVRRRIPRVLKACPTPRAADGLRRALDDPAFGVRAAAAAALAAHHEKNPETALPREARSRVRGVSRVSPRPRWRAGESPERASPGRSTARAPDARPLRRSSGFRP